MDVPIGYHTKWSQPDKILHDIAYSGAVNTDVHISFQIMIFSSYMPESGITGSSVALFLVF